MLPDPRGFLDGSGNLRGNPPRSYVRLATKLHLGVSKTEYSPAVEMEGYNALFLECVVVVAQGAPDPLLKIYVLASNDKSNWATVPVGGVAVFLSAGAAGYFAMDQDDIGQISARYVRLRYETDASTTAVILSAGVNRKRIGI